MPALWFNDIYRQDKTPFCQAEIDVIKSVNGVCACLTERETD